MLNRVKLNRAELNHAKRAFVIKKKLPYGYLTSFGYKGWLNSIMEFQEFESEDAYIDYLKDHPEEES